VITDRQNSAASGVMASPSSATARELRSLSKRFFGQKKAYEETIFDRLAGLSETGFGAIGKIRAPDTSG